MAPGVLSSKFAYDDFVPTIEDDESDVPDLDAEDDANDTPQVNGVGQKRKREDDPQSSKGQSKKKSKKRKQAAESEEVEEVDTGEAPQAKNDRTFNDEFEFFLASNVGVVEGFGEWALAATPRDDPVSGGRRALGIDEIVARRKAQKKDSPAEVDDADEADDSGSEQEMNGFAGFEDEGDETLAEDAFGMGVVDDEDEEDEDIVEGDASNSAADEDEDEDNEDAHGANGKADDENEEDNDSEAEPVPHPDDALYLDMGDEEAERFDPKEAEKRAAFYAPEDMAGENEPLSKTSTSFQTMSLSRPILKGLATVGFTVATPIQVKTIPVALMGKDVVGGAETGSGKTAAFMIPILERLLYRPRKVPTTRVAILMPTRELAAQCYNEQAKSPINLLRGWPNSSLLPNTALVNSMQRVMANTPLAAEGLLYGPDEGHLPLRKSISSWLRAFYEPATSRWQKSLPSRSKSAAISIKSQPASNTPTTSTTQPSSAAPKADNKGHATTTDPLTNRITITGGASQSLGVILTVFTDPLYTRRVWIVAPGYFMSFRIFEDAGFAGRMRAVPEIQPRSDPEYDAENDIAGPDVAWLRREIAAVDAEEEQNGHEDHSPTISNSYKPPSKYPRQYRHVIYTVPNFANPSGLMTSLRTREALVRCAREFDALIICDDVYDMLQWPAEEDIAAVKASEGLVAVNAGGAEAVADKHQIAAKETRDHALKAPGTAPLPRLIDIDAHLDGGPQDDYGNVISNGSFSKICAPGCRVGWIEATPTLAFAASQQ